ncbi:bifunctional RNase H/acid phosphatase [Rhodococcus chondri]|uniref:Bifunctional RNase H/acid phosphatase n=1 Tax=Rhodococcus chondri TaxID=3065941 RepID=A0ABU7JZ53_9NOCA|nr:bifunctional RNase H/acid phosphatase [Rhodococcus sp. CC-R104]MEE2035293.1 bifunctional RNase H/acid phosphatase [Rhodococcus sp. CC-R104]
MRFDSGAYQGIGAVTRVVVEADGGSRGNPGPAGYGAVVFDTDHRTVLAERHASIGRATNNVAEYRGLIAGLTAAAELGADEAEVRMDSKLVVEQMSGRWKIKHPDMIPLAAEARALAAKFTRVVYTWVPRAQNSYADRLANEAMDAVAGIATAGAGFPVGSAQPVDTQRVTEDPVVSEPVTSEPATGTAPGWTGAVGIPTRLLLLRHGQTPLSVERRYSGRGNPPLTEFGRDQAAAAALRMGARGGIAAVVSSPLGRARETATAAADALNLPVTVHEGLIETDFGAWEGLTFVEAAERDPELHRRWLGDTSVRPPGGESFDEVRERIAGVRDDLVDEYGGANVLVVTHVTPIKTFLRFALDSGPSLLFRLHLDLASLSIAEFYPDGGSSVRLVNDTSHL